MDHDCPDSLVPCAIARPRAKSEGFSHLSERTEEGARLLPTATPCHELALLRVIPFYRLRHRGGHLCVSTMGTEGFRRAHTWSVRRKTYLLACLPNSLPFFYFVFVCVFIFCFMTYRSRNPLCERRRTILVTPTDRGPKTSQSFEPISVIK